MTTVVYLPSAAPRSVCPLVSWYTAKETYCQLFFFSSRRRHTRLQGDWSSDGSSDLLVAQNRFLPSDLRTSVSSSASFMVLQPFCGALSPSLTPSNAPFLVA